jgi:hypothetical protein
MIVQIGYATFIILNDEHQFTAEHLPTILIVMWIIMVPWVTISWILTVRKSRRKQGVDK